jgi:Spy/CpxP family protein refolding chaperone
MKTQTILVTFIILLIILNSITIFLLLKKEKRGRFPHRPDPAFMTRKLGFDEAQQQRFETMRQQHFERRDQLRNEDIRLHKEMGNMIKQGIADSTKIDSVLSLIAGNRKNFERNFYYHFLEIHSMLKPEQQQSFNDLLDIIIRRQSPPTMGPAAPPVKPE